MGYNKEQGYEGELLVQKHYQDKGYVLLHKNYTIVDGEIDLIFSYEESVVFVEVKVINYVNDVHDYITHHKLRSFCRTIHHYCHRYRVDTRLRMDVAFVESGQIVDLFEDIEL